MKRKLSVIGIGAGDPHQLTLQAVEAFGLVDVVFLPDKGGEKTELSALRSAICHRFTRPDHCRLVTFEVPSREKIVEDYRKTVADWHAAIADLYRGLFQTHLTERERGALLVWGDPSLYDSTLRILERVQGLGMEFELDVIPGISAIHLLAARHQIALHAIGEPMTVIPARRLGDEGLPPHLQSAVIVLDGEERFSSIDDTDLEIFWGASLGLADEILIAGDLSDVKGEILARRAEARARKGWLMDTYLLRRRIRPAD